MIHFIYKTTHTESGKYYIGRHSTENEQAGYLGSGKWIRSIKDKSKLSREIIGYYNSFDELILAEQNEIIKNIDNEFNMNFNNTSVGFATGDLNPAKSENERKRRSDQNWMKSADGKRYLSENNPSKKESIRIMRKNKCKEQLSFGSHNFQNKETIEKRKNAGKLRFIQDNPMNKISNRVSASAKQKDLLATKAHNFQLNREYIDSLSRERMIINNPMKDPKISMLFKQPKEQVTCPHCLKTGGKPAMVRYHFNKCKMISNIKRSSHSG